MCYLCWKLGILHSYLIVMQFIIQLIKGVCERSSLLRVLHHDNRFLRNVGTLSRLCSITPKKSVILMFTTLRNSGLRLQ